MRNEQYGMQNNQGAISKGSPRSGEKKKRKRRDSHPHRAITIFIFLLLTIYMLGYVLVFINRPSIKVETVNYGTVDVPTAFDGIAVRNEYTVKAPLDGVPEFIYSEGEKIKTGANVCKIKKDDSSALIESQIAKIDKDIINMQKNRSDISVFQEDINRIENNIRCIVDGYSFKVSGGSFSDVYIMKDQIESQMNMRTQIWMTENTKSFEELSAAKGQFEQQLSGSIASVSIPDGGILSMSIDGLEEKYNHDMIKNITKEETKMKTEFKYVSKTQKILKDDPVFRIIRDNIWYIASYIPNDIASKWAVKDNKIITTTVNEQDKSVEATIESLDIGATETFVVFKTNKNLIDFMDIRNMEFYIRDDIYKGLKIPNKAIVEKSFVKVPKECIIENAGKTGVIKRSETGDNFVELTVSRYDDSFGYVQQDFSTIKLGETVLKGKGEKAEARVIDGIFTYKGVYVANSSFAKFTIIDILGQNNEYAIVDASLQYGLKVYDKIVSDGQSIKEGDEVF